MSICLRCIVRGRVQGVFFRASTKEVADGLGLAGHAINLSDGRVEVIARGSDTELDELKHFLQDGPEHAAVTAVSCETWDGHCPDGGFYIG